MPALLGDDLTSGFTTHFDSSVAFEAQGPKDFGRTPLPMFGGQATRPVIDSYVWRQSQSSEITDEE